MDDDCDDGLGHPVSRILAQAAAAEVAQPVATDVHFLRRLVFKKKIMMNWTTPEMNNMTLGKRNWGKGIEEVNECLLSLRSVLNLYLSQFILY